MLKILVVDDEEIICDLICALIDWEKYQMQLLGCVYDGEEAFEVICDKRPDVVITDIRMPGMDGLEMIKKAREEKIEAQFLILSGYKDFSYAQEAIRLGAAAYLLKPIEEEELLNTLLKIQEKNEIAMEQSKEKQALNQQLVDSRYRLWHQFLTDFLEGRETAKYGLKEVTEEEINRVFGPKFCGGLYRAAVLRWDNPYGSITEEESRYLTGKCIDFFCTCLPESMVWYAAETKECQLVLLNGTEEETGQEVWTAFHKMQAYASALNEGVVTAGLSRTAQVPAMVPALAKEAEKACSMRILKGCGKILEYDAAAFSPCKVEELLSMKKAKELQERLELMDWEQMKDAARELYENIPGEADPDVYYQLHLRILTEVLQGLSYLGAEVADMRGLIERMCRELRCCSSIAQIIRKTNGQIQEILLSCKEQSVLKENRLANIAKEYIRKNYNKDIRLADVAEQVYLSPTYFSAIFKRETGMNFNEYLTEYRIEMAKEFLKNLEYKVTEVGEQVGYEDSKYFSKIFRKMVGISPRDYRKLYMRDKI